MLVFSSAERLRLAAYHPYWGEHPIRKIIITLPARNPKVSAPDRNGTARERQVRERRTSSEHPVRTSVHQQVASSPWQVMWSSTSSIVRCQPSSSAWRLPPQPPPRRFRGCSRERRSSPGNRSRGAVDDRDLVIGCECPITEPLEDATHSHHAERVQLGGVRRVCVTLRIFRQVRKEPPDFHAGRSVPPKVLVSALWRN